MEYESAKSAAQRLGVTERAVQKWASTGKIIGAKKVGRQWLVPVGEVVPCGNSKVGTTVTNHRFMPFLSGNFDIKNCLDFIDSIEDEGDREIALAEYYYYTGQAQKSVLAAEKYINSKDIAQGMSASFVYTFANLSLGKSHLAELGLENIDNYAKKALLSEDSETYAGAVFIANASAVLMHMPRKDLPPLDRVMNKLPKGLKLFSAYILSHDAYLKKEYSLSLGIVSISLAIKDGSYPIPSLYLSLMKCIDLMSLKRSDEAKACFDSVYTAIDNRFYQPFAEHHGLLQGMLESRVKKQHPEDFKRIIDLVQSFSKSWRIVHNELTESSVTVHLTTTEFAVAMLFNRSWSVKEIAAHMDISPRMVKHHLSVIYEKLGVSNREELGQYMLK